MYRKESSIDNVAECKGHQETRKGGREVKEFNGKIMEFKRFWVCWEG